MAVASGASVTVNTYTVPLGRISYLQRVTSSGTNITTYYLYVNALLLDVTRTYYGSNLSTTNEFTAGPAAGYQLNAGDVVTVQITNYQPSPGDFECRIQVLET